MRVSLIIPCYNEERTIAAVLQRILALQIAGADQEIVVVNDGSTDGTRTAIDAFPWPAGTRVQVYHAPLNYGKGAALRMGLSLATGDVLAFQDADLELDPADLPGLITPVVRGEVEAMFGSRFLSGVNRSVPRASRWANWVLSWLTSVLFLGRVTDMETAYKVLHRRVAERLRLRCVEFDIEPEITAKVLRLGYKIHERPIRYSPRTVRDGKKIGLADGIQAVWTLFRIRILPRSACERPVSRSVVLAQASVDAASVLTAPSPIVDRNLVETKA